MTQRKDAHLALVFGLLVLIGITRGGSQVAVRAKSAHDVVITTFDVAGATSTSALDINAGGFIVGRYVSAGRTHGFLRDPDGTITTIDVPGAQLTVAAGINNSGTIVGQYALPTAPAQRHGFLLMDGEFTTIDPPGSTFTNVLGINERGDIVGRFCAKAVCRPPGSGDLHGFLLHDGEFTIIDVTGADETDLFRIAGREQIVGGDATGGTEEIWLLNRDTFTPLTIPSGQPSLDTGGVNERGDVVGTYCDNAFPCLITPTGTHGFLLSAGSFTPIDIDGALGTSATGINASRQIVGAYSTDGKSFHAFLITPGIDQTAK